MGAPENDATTTNANRTTEEPPRRNRIGTWWATLDGDRRIAVIFLVFQTITPAVWYGAHLGLSHAGQAAATLPSTLALIVAIIGIVIILITHRDNTLRRNVAVRAALAGEPPLPMVTQHPDPTAFTLPTSVRPPSPLLDMRPAISQPASPPETPPQKTENISTADCHSDTARAALEAEPPPGLSEKITQLHSTIDQLCTDRPIAFPTSPENYSRTQQCINLVCAAIRTASPTTSFPKTAHPEQQAALNLMLSFLPSPQQKIATSSHASRTRRNKLPDYIFDLSGASMMALDFHGIAWSAHPDNVQFRLYGCDLRSAQLAYGDFRHADLTKANLRDANLQQTNLGYSLLQKSCLQNVNAEGANLSGANLRDADLQHSTLRSASMEHVRAQDASLNHTNLQGADLCRAALWNTSLQHADLTEANMQEANLWEANLRYGSLKYAVLRSASLHRTNFQHADMQHAALHRADLWSTDLRHATLHHANLYQANLHGTRLNHAKLADASFSWLHPDHPELTFKDLLGDHPWRPHKVCDALAEAEQALQLPSDVLEMILQAALGSEYTKELLWHDPALTSSHNTTTGSPAPLGIPFDAPWPPQPHTKVSTFTAARLDGAIALASTFDGAQVAGMDFSTVRWVDPHGDALPPHEWPAYATDR